MQYSMGCASHTFIRSCLIVLFYGSHEREFIYTFWSISTIITASPLQSLLSDTEQNDGSEMGNEAGFEMDSDSEDSEERIPLAQIKVTTSLLFKNYC